jgi:hypothetical protein
MGFKEHLHEWETSGALTLRIQRETHILSRAVLLQCKGQAIPVLLELTADRRERGMRTVCRVRA